MFRRKPDLERIALDFALSKILGDEVKFDVLAYFEFKQQIVMNSKEPISREEVNSVLEAFFGAGGALIVGEFNKKLDELQAEKSKHLHAET